MKINKLTASFGRLENETLSFHDGLNVIYAPNESGKSTWCAFIQAMLYGIDSSQRVRSGFLPDKLRYAPWSGAPMEGSMELTADDRDITISRRTKAKNAPMQVFSAEYTGTNTPVKGLTGANAGEQLTGVSKDVFRRSAFIAQGTVAVTGSPELEKRVSAIVSTGEEQTSYSEADERLRAWQRKRRYNRRGYLPELEGKMDEAQRRLDELGSSLVNVEELEGRLEKTRRECSALEQQVTDARKRQRREALDRLNRGRAELKACSARHDEAMEELAVRREELRSSVFGLKEPELLRDEIAADTSEYEALNAPAERSPRPLPALLLLLMAVAAAVLYLPLDSVVCIIAAAVLFIGAAVLLIRMKRVRREQADALERQAKLLKKYRAQSLSDIHAAYEEHQSAWESMAQASDAEQHRRAEYENARDLQARLEEAALAELDFSDGDSEAARISRELSRSRAAAEALSRQVASANGRLAAMGDPLILASELSCMKEEYEQISEEYDAISLAVDTLKSADAEMQSRFSPELGRVAAGYMSSITGGRYSDVLINRDFSAKTKTADDSVAREAEYLSAGTMDIMYLAVRLAVCELALPEGKSCPLIIDDALVNLDEKRFSQAMALLQDISESRQVILFTCRRQSE